MRNYFNKKVYGFLAVLVIVSMIGLWWPVKTHAAFSYYKTITIDHTKVPNTDQTNFPVLISLTDANLKSTGNGGNVQNANGYDIRPYSDAGLSSALTFELENYNASTGEVVMWVKVPTLSHTSDYVIYLAYGDATISTNGSSSSTWDSDFKGVWHLPNGSTLTANDSTSNANNGTSRNGVTAASGQIDGAASFASASSQQITTATNFGSNAIGQSYSESGWIKTSSKGNTVMGFTGDQLNDGGGWDRFFYTDSSTGVIRFAYYPGSYPNGLTGATSVTDGNWHFVYVTKTSGGNGLIYIDGNLDATGADGGGSYAGYTVSYFHIGYAGNLNWTNNTVRYFNGTMDEVRLSDIARSADWIKTEYNNQSATSTFYTVGSQTPFSSESATSKVIATGRLLFNGRVMF